MSAVVDSTHGLILTAGGGVVGEVLSFDYSGVTRPALDTTNMTTAAAAGGLVFGNKTFIPGRTVDPGTLTLTGHFNPDDAPSIEDAASSIVLDFFESGGDTTSGATWTSSGFLTEFSLSGASGETEEKLIHTLVFKLTGAVTVVAGVS